jgi:hypothetical protein
MRNLLILTMYGRRIRLPNFNKATFARGEDERVALLYYSFLKCIKAFRSFGQCARVKFLRIGYRVNVLIYAGLSSSFPALHFLFDIHGWCNPFGS